MTYNKLISLMIWLALAMVGFRCQNSVVAEENQVIPPVYITVAGHIEDTAVYADRNAYPDYRSKLLVFADLLVRTGVVFNLQIDYEFLFGTSRWETEAMRTETDGLNVIDYLATRCGIEVDAHQEGGVEEGMDNYADVRYLGGTLTSLISENIGGMVWNDSAQFAMLAAGESGWLYPEFTWHPQILTLAVSQAHHSGDFSNDDVTSGIWKPKGASADFWVHNPDARMVYVGPGEYDSNWGGSQDSDALLSPPEFIKHLASALQAGTISREKMYTVTLAVPQSVIFDTNEHSKLTAQLDEIAPCIQSGRAQYVTYSEAVEIWTTRFGGQYNIYHRNTNILDVPLVDSIIVASITATNAASGGNVIWDGNATIMARGVCWSESINPTITNSHTTDGSGTGVFTSAMTHLFPESVYHVRAYAASTNGTAYGQHLSFTSAPAVYPVPYIQANDSMSPVTVTNGTPVSVAVSLYPGQYAGSEADWWVLALALNSEEWYYLNENMEWRMFSGNTAECQPAYQGPLFNLSSTVVVNGYVFPPGTFYFYFGVDPGDGILNYPDGPIFYDQVTVMVQ